MKTLIVYDSIYGNTRIIAEAIAQGIPGQVALQQAGEVHASELSGFDLLVIGAPTQGGRPTESVQILLDSVSGTALQGKKVAAFDTRLKAKWVKIFNYAAPRIASTLQEKGGVLVNEPAGFIVKGRSGPLLEGEVERAREWGKRIGETRV